MRNWKPPPPDTARMCLACRLETIHTDTQEQHRPACRRMRKELDEIRVSVSKAEARSEDLERSGKEWGELHASHLREAAEAINEQRERAEKAEAALAEALQEVSELEELSMRLSSQGVDSEHTCPKCRTTFRYNGPEMEIVSDEETEG